MSSKPTPREQFLQAGNRLLGELDATDLARSLSIAAVVDDAGLSHQTFHNAYPGNSRSGGTGGKEAFVADLLDNLTVHYSGIVAADPPTGVRDAAAPMSALFDNLTSGLMRRRLIAVLFAADHEGARKAVTPEFDRLDADLRTVVGQAIQSQGGSVRRPLSLTSLSTALGALVDGFAIREMLTPGSVATEDVAEAATSILRWAVDPVHSDRNSPEPTPEHAPAASASLRPDLEADVIAATEALFLDNGYFLVTLADIAAAAHIRVDDLRRLFPSKVDIIVAALTPEFDRVLRLRRADERLGIDPATALQRTLISLADFVIDNRAMSTGMLLALSFEQFQQPSTITTVMEHLYLPSAVVPILERGRDVGVFTDEAPIPEVAIMLTNNVLFRCLTRPTDTAADVVAGVLRVMMPGVATKTP
ncbi:TetR/AcrR family transcriptional regulator [Rhodococcus sp. ARC_M5]|uniref:TetR/AcrR family transcriptional regulator n=1 Tax=Rhodococcus sp. ARC_M5 TaxID=2928851 RepID=UPI001FB23600|nr:TetR/AcrR family transcriptional regulator [Rhodococcus sp. ARC_M5]MCJ0892578.1 TetR/AcrR family transcriptional regulator [Rhodococcus sp. ARC_M5]